MAPPPAEAGLRVGGDHVGAGWQRLQPHPWQRGLTVEFIGRPFLSGVESPGTDRLVGSPDAARSWKPQRFIAGRAAGVCASRYWRLRPGRHRRHAWSACPGQVARSTSSTVFFFGRHGGLADVLADEVLGPFTGRPMSRGSGQPRVYRTISQTSACAERASMAPVGSTAAVNVHIPVESSASVAASHCA